MVENYIKDVKESVYHRAVVSVLAVGYTMLGKTLIKMSPPSLSKFDIEDGVKLVYKIRFNIEQCAKYHTTRSTIRFYEGLCN